MLGRELTATLRAPPSVLALAVLSKPASALCRPPECVRAVPLAPAVPPPPAAPGLAAPATSAMDRATTSDAPTRFLSAKTLAV